MSNSPFKNIEKIEDLFVNDTDTRPVMVSVECITYNHENFIREALDGFLMQKTNFRFEVIVHDDASTDNTAVIIMEYAEKYPEIIKPILEKENIFPKDNGATIIKTVIKALRGKYVAICEGDDYWTDPNKLQKQVDFMETNYDYTMCFHDSFVKYEDFPDSNHNFANLENREYSAEEIASDWIIPTASMVLRKTILDSDIYAKVLDSKNLVVGDTPLERTCCYYGKVFGFKKIMSVYRIHSNGMTATINSYENLIPLMMQEIEYKKIFCGKFNNFPNKKIAYFTMMFPSCILRKEYKTAINLIKLGFKFAPLECCLRFLALPIIYIKGIIHKNKIRTLNK